MISWSVTVVMRAMEGSSFEEDRIPGGGGGGGGGGGKVAAREGRKEVLDSIAWEGGTVCPSKGTRKWSQVEKGVKEGTGDALPILGPRWRCMRWTWFRMKGECEGERGECEKVRGG